jgi:multicomponent Na+:H+ antiporter subunit E
MDTTNIKGTVSVGNGIWRTRWTVIGVEFVALFGFWILLSGRFQLKYLVIGLFVSAAVTCFTHSLLFKPRVTKTSADSSGYILSCAWRLAGYMVWLVWAIIKASIQIAFIILRPKMPIEPGILKCKTDLRNKVALVTLGNSITITPGSVTLEVGSGNYVIHYLLPAALSDLESGLMSNKVGRVFGDNHDAAPICEWACNEKEETIREKE